jgi:hypothetical protein
MSMFKSQDEREAEKREKEAERAPVEAARPDRVTPQRRFL